MTFCDHRKSEDADTKGHHLSQPSYICARCWMQRDETGELVGIILGYRMVDPGYAVLGELPVLASRQLVVMPEVVAVKTSRSAKGPLAGEPFDETSTFRERESRG